ncbi:MAG: RNA-splicing ligase RtcB [Bacteroidetes bacterium]|nr:MAG: RNA-splicing ligase RtcB [Bacteroidota bacterium]
MKQRKIRGNHIKKLGTSDSIAISMSIDILKKHYKHANFDRKLKLIAEVLKAPEKFTTDEHLGQLADYLIPQKEEVFDELSLTAARPFTVFGDENIDKNAKHQMYQAMKLPVVLDGALMPDSHYGYGLPIGGVLATNNAVIPYGVGVDIGCRMCLSIYRDDPKILHTRRDELKRILKEHTKFGLRETHDKPNRSEVIDSSLFAEIPMLKRLQKKAAMQLGSSGGGNHFVEFGIVKIPEDSKDLNLKKGEYLGLLSHSGSRGLGATIAKHYTELAKNQSHLPKGVRNLAWLDLKSEEGIEYWLAMNLAGDYASACHHDIHKRIAKIMKLQAKTVVENHHNFAWKEVLSDGTEAIVHRKGATPAGEGVLGVIPGSMTAPGYIVKGRGNVQSINSASHGAGRLMSRRAAKQGIAKDAMKKVLKDHGVELIGGGVDEAPMAYKNIDTVMSYQQDLVDVLGSFTPKIVRMSKE